MTNDNNLQKINSTKELITTLEQEGKITIENIRERTIDLSKYSLRFEMFNHICKFYINEFYMGSSRFIQGFVEVYSVKEQRSEVTPVTARIYPEMPNSEFELSSSTVMEEYFISKAFKLASEKSKEVLDNFSQSVAEFLKDSLTSDNMDNLYSFMQVDMRNKFENIARFSNKVFEQEGLSLEEQKLSPMQKEIVNRVNTDIKTLRLIQNSVVRKKY